MIYIDLRHSTITGVKKYTEKLVEAGIYDRAIGSEDIKILDLPCDVVKCDDYAFVANKKMPIGKEDVLHCPFIYYPFGFNGKVVVTIHDLIPLVVKGNVSFAKKIIYFVKLKYISKHARHIITVSRHTKRDLIKYLKVKPGKVSVVYIGADREIKKRKREEVNYIYDQIGIEHNKKIILMIGNRSKHKNMGRGIRAYYAMDRKEDVIIVIVGKKNERRDEVSRIINNYRLNGRIKELSDLSIQDLEALYNIADVLLFPSLYEGFGLPPLEAMNCGTPVICSKTSSLPEVVGDAAYLIDPYNVKEMTKALDEVLFNDELREQLIEKGYERVKKFSWERTAKRTLSILCRFNS